MAASIPPNPKNGRRIFYVKMSQGNYKIIDPVSYERMADKVTEKYASTDLMKKEKKHTEKDHERMIKNGYDFTVYRSSFRYTSGPVPAWNRVE